MNGLSEAERDQLLTPCDCGHSINDHGSLDTCWTCSEDNQECAYYFEDLLTARIGAIVAARLASVEGARHATADWGRSYNAPRTGIGGPASQRLPDPRDEALARVKALSGHAIAAAIYSGGGAVHPDASDRVLDLLLRAVLGSDAHTEQKGAGDA